MTEEKKFNCILCNSKFDSKEKLNEHFRIHADKNKESTFVSNDGGASKTEQIPCDVCSQLFKTISLAIQHKYKKHPDAVMKYFCKFCGMQFPLKSTHDKHLSTHSKDTSSGEFTCAECNATFVTENGRRYHTKSAHNRVTSLIQPVNTPPPSKKIRLNNANEAQSVYYCHLCGFPYINKFNLQRHLESNHSLEECNNVPSDLLRCTTCDALFYTKQAYDSHVFDHKPDDLYVTSEEQRLQTVTRVDQDFDIRRVQLAVEKFLPNKISRNQNNKKKFQLDKVSKSQEESDEELSPTSEVESSDEEEKTNETKTSQASLNKNDNQLKSKTVGQKIVKKKFYAIVDKQGTVMKTCTNIPKNAVLTKSNVITLKNKDILKTLQKADINKVSTKVIKVTDNLNNKLKTASETSADGEQCAEDNSIPSSSKGNTICSDTVENNKDNSKTENQLVNKEVLNENNEQSLNRNEEDPLAIKEEDLLIPPSKINNNSKDIKIILDRLPEKYEKILCKIKSTNV